MILGIFSVAMVDTMVDELSQSQTVWPKRGAGYSNLSQISNRTTRNLKSTCKKPKRNMPDTEHSKTS